MANSRTLRRAVEETEAGTKSARLRQVMPEIEQRLAAGARISDVVETLNRNGLPITIATLKSYLYRFRKAARSAESVTGDTHDRFARYEEADDEAYGSDLSAIESAGQTAGSAGVASLTGTAGAIGGTGGTGASTTVLLRHINTAKCLRLLRRGASYSRADLARELGLTRATIGHAVRELIQSGLVVETSDRLEGGRPGRPGSGVRLNASGAYAIGIEIGTASMTAVLVDLGMRVIRRITQPAEYGENDVERAIGQLAHLPSRLLAATDIDPARVHGVGVSVPGLVDHSGGVVVAPFLGWYDVPLKQILSERAETRWPVTVCNDAVAFAHAERTVSSERDAHNMLLMLLAEGLGGAIVQRGQIFEGAHGFAGELGHMVMGRSPGAIATENFEALGGYHRFRPFFPEGLVLAEALQWLAENADRIATPALQAAFDEWADVLTTGILNLIYLFDPEKIVLGGPLSALFPRVEAKVKKSLAANLLRGYKPPPIYVTRFGADGASIGAAAVVRDQLFSLPRLEHAMA
ncbi:HTH marR-type domain-containing protein [Pararobbsia alpina]|uniref:ROK family protein n=1 Tax=Pararobbsia alpina TaxID=621374 RepID=UPI0039A783E5